MRPDLIGPRPLRQPILVFGLVKGSPEWYAIAQTDEIIKADPFGMLSLSTVMDTIYAQDNLQKAETEATVAGKPSAKQAQAQAPTMVASSFRPSPVDPHAKTEVSRTPQHPEVSGTSRTSGLLPDMSHPAKVSSPGHKLALHQVLTDHHVFEHHRNNLSAGDSTQAPEVRAQAKAHAEEHGRLAQNAQKVVNHYKQQGVEATDKHHADLTLHFDQNKDNPKYAGGVKHPLQPNWQTIRTGANAKSGNWDKHYGAPKPTEWEKPEVRSAMRVALGEQGFAGTQHPKLPPTASEKTKFGHRLAAGPPGEARKSIRADLIGPRRLQPAKI